MISLIHPSRGRPQKAKETARKWLDEAGCDVEHILSLDSDDPLLKDYQKGFRTIIRENRSAVDAINNAAEISKGSILMVVSDDTDCPPMWGKKIIDFTVGRSDWIAKCGDGIQNWIITMPVMDRVYYNRFGYIYHPDFLHMFCDTFLTCVADLTGRRINLPIEFPHLHYSTGKSEKDAISERADKTWAQGEATFLNFARKNFLLTPDQVKGKITDVGYLNWIRTKV